MPRESDVGIVLVIHADDPREADIDVAMSAHFELLGEAGKLTRNVEIMAFTWLAVRANARIPDDRAQHKGA